MANSYDVRLHFGSSASPTTLVFRTDLALEQAVQLANSLWLSTDNVTLQVAVCEKNSSTPSVIYHPRSE